MPDVTSKEDSKSRPNIHFYHAEHLNDNLEEIWDHAKDTDVILMELITEKKFRSDLENLINYGSSSEDPEEKSRVIKIVESSTNGGLLAELAKRIINSGKEVYFVDVNYGEDGQIDAAGSFSSLREAEELFAKGDFEKSLSTFTDYIDLTASSSKEREDVTANEIQGILDENREKWSGKNIAVIQGALHTRTYHKAKHDNPGVNINRAFPEPEYYFPQNIVLIRRIIFDKPVSADDYKKAYLSYFVIVDALIDTKGNSLKDREIPKAYSRIIGKIGQQDLEKYWEELKAGKLDATKLVNQYF